jgi:hypothetical protein
VADVVASTANNLRLDGWISGQSWGSEAALPPNFNYLFADSSRPLTVRQWQSLGVRRADAASFPRIYDRAELLLPAGARGPAFLTLHNFSIIMKYNPAEAYALAIGELADRLNGGGRLVHPWPREERVLTLQERHEIQELLAQRGYRIGEPDGFIGPQTRLAIRGFQKTVGAIPDGFASSEVLDRLRQQ